MNGSIALTCLLVAPGPEDCGIWYAWCPELDIASQGENPGHAAGSLGEAVRITVYDDLLAFNYTFGSIDLTIEGPPSRKRVTHPLRRSENNLKSAREDEFFPVFDDYENRRNEWNETAYLTFSDVMDGKDKYAITHGHLSWRCQFGIVSVNDPEFGPHLQVPAKTYWVEIEMVKPISSRHQFEVRLSELEETPEDVLSEFLARKASESLGHNERLVRVSDKPRLKDNGSP